MTEGRDSAGERVKNLSKDKLKLLRRLIGTQSNPSEAIAPVSRDTKTQDAVWPTSPAQQRLWFVTQIEGASAAYHLPVVVSICGDLHIGSLQAALSALVERHEVLRTVFVELDGEPFQKVLESQKVALEFTDLSVIEADDRESEILKLTREEIAAPFDLRAGPLLRARLLRRAGDAHTLVITMHHIVSDGWSIGVMMNELWPVYDAHRAGVARHLAPLPIQYVDFALWQRQWLAGEEAEKQLSYWKEDLAGAPELLELPADRRRPVVQSYRGATTHVNIGAETTAALRAFARQHNVTLATVLHTAWVVLLSRLTGQGDIVVGMPVANRQRPELEGLIGFFVNTIALRVRFDNDPQITTLLRRVQAIMLSAYLHQDVPFERVVDAIHPVRTLDHNPIFQVMLAVQNTPRSEVGLSGLTFIEQQVQLDTAKCDVTFSLREHSEGIAGSLNYATDLFEEVTARRWCGCFELVLGEILRNPGQAASNVSILSATERLRVVELFNATEVFYPRSRLVHELFEGHVERAPGAVAIEFEGRTMTYADLNARANELARYLIQRGVSVGDYVPILMPRCPQMLVAQLAVLKCGGAYVPIDPMTPRERKAFILRDCAARHALTEQSTDGLLDVSGVEFINLVEASGIIQRLSSDNVNLRIGCMVSAYVMYTSGSTGTPKGVIVPHRAVIRLVINNWFARVERADCIAHCSNPAFDAATFEVWGALLNGARTLIVSHDVVLDEDRFARTLREGRATILFLTTSLFNQRAVTSPGVFKGISYLIFGGEAADQNVVRKAIGSSGANNLVNGYGPTETTTFAAAYQLKSIQPMSRSIPIGTPIANTRVYILDRHLQPTPIGVPGEIFIGGPGVAWGYVNRPELTSERFIADPFNLQGGERLYKTGDIGCWKEDGNIEYQGRNDHQVKIRGYRIEIGEIEAQLGQHEKVREVAVVATEDSTDGKRLIAYLTLHAGNSITSGELHEKLRRVLPEYMVPSAFVVMRSLPVTSNGKLDRRRLPMPRENDFVRRNYEAPQGETEQALAALWQEMLHVDRVSRNDNFFTLGGHSLLALKLLARLAQSSEVPLRISDLYGNPTLRDLASHMKGGSAVDEKVDLMREAILDEEIRSGTPYQLRRSPKAVLLTGATGFVGRFLLTEILEKTDSRVFCLVRAETTGAAEVRLITALKKWNLWSIDAERRIVAVPGDLAAPALGLERSIFHVLVREVDTVYHCATSMNHLETFSMARRANVHGSIELLKLAVQSRPKVINYISTLSIFSSLGRESRSTVNESSPIEFEEHLHSAGYAASKWVAEKVFMIARDRGIPCNIFRLGLVWADSMSGRFDELQHAYRLLKSGLMSGSGIEGFRFNMAPTPVDYVVRAIVSLANGQPKGGGIFHIASSRQPDRGLFESCNEVLERPLALLPYPQWIREIRRLYGAGQSLPIVPLVEFTFSMDDAALSNITNAARLIQVDCTETEQELERRGVLVSATSDYLAEKCLQSMMSRDDDLHGCDFVVRARSAKSGFV